MEFAEYPTIIIIIRTFCVHINNKNNKNTENQFYNLHKTRFFPKQKQEPSHNQFEIQKLAQLV